MNKFVYRMNIETLEAKKTGLEAELKALYEAPCPRCDKSGSSGKIRVDNPDGDGFSYEPCPECNETGYLLGEHPPASVYR